jgi:hypothetical protein
MTTITVDTSGLVDGTAADAADVLNPITDLKTAIENILNGIQVLDFVNLNGICDGRLTLTTAVPVTVSDVTAATTLYFTPYKGNRIALFDGTSWKVLTFTEKSLDISALVANTNYDVWAFNNSGSVTLEATAWASDTARATAITLQNGVYVKSGSTTRRYLGTIRITGTTGQCEDSVTKRFVWNYHHRVPRSFVVVDNTATWVYASTTWRAANNSTSNRIQFVKGLSEDIVWATLQDRADTGGAGNIAGISFGYDSTTVIDTQGGYSGNASVVNAPSVAYSKVITLGYHYIQALEQATAGSVTFYGNAYFKISGTTMQ